MDCEIENCEKYNDYCSLCDMISVKCDNCDPWGNCQCS